MTMRLWLFDFDGTLSQLVADRDAAVLDPACANMLKELIQSPSDLVAIISSRKLSDIAPRIPMDDIIVGGSSGIEWRFPGGSKMHSATDKEDALLERRHELMPYLKILSEKPGVDIEDKYWSVAIHMNIDGDIDLARTAKTINAWAKREHITLSRGPNVLEIQFIHGFNKSHGAAFLADVLKVDPQKDTIIYAGDDENDAVAMWWSIMTGGAAIMVGAKLDVPGAIYVQNQQGLVDAVTMLRQAL